MAQALIPAYTSLTRFYSGPCTVLVQGPGIAGALMKTLFVLLLGCLLSVASAADIYKWFDAEGNVHYGDEPGGGSARKMEQLPGLSTYAPPPIKVQQQEPAKVEPEKTAPEKDAVAYRSITIVKPENGETIRSNPGLVEIFIALAPPLGKTDHIRVTLDGQPLPGQHKKTVVQLENVDRGEHQLNVAVYNSNGRRLAGSPTHTFYLHKASVNNRIPGG